jgi:hypothetical protein
MEPCPVCGAESAFLWTKRILRRYDVAYFRCGACQAIHTEAPYWLEEAYGTAIVLSDTGVVRRNVRFVIEVSGILRGCGMDDPVGVDYGGGYGLFTRMMRDIGYRWLWSDPFCQNIFARGFEWAVNSPKPDVVTAFEVMEHLVDPHELFSTVFQRWGAKMLIASTITYSGERPQEDWQYFATHSGQHILLYHECSLRALAKAYGLNVVSIGSVHIFSRETLGTRNRRWNIVNGITNVLRRLARRRSLTQRDSDELINRSH